MLVLPGVELTHMRPSDIAEGANLARELGALIVIVHGETIAEPVEPGTNQAAIEAGADILAHPGLISPDCVNMAAERNVMLEISGKGGHSLANGHVAKLAAKYGATLIFGSDAHTPDQMPTREYATKICLAAGLEPAQVEAMFKNAEAFARARAIQQEREEARDY
jgi:histidinol phosphatase-like PHP family hydrolase